MVDFARLSANWSEWSSIAQLADIAVSMDCDDCDIAFISRDYSVHLRNDGTWWIIDTVDDRGQRHDDTAKLSTLDLTEKYLIWKWASTARGAIGAGRLGPRLYKLGFNPEVEVFPIAEGISELRSKPGNAVLMEPDATIFSHLMSKTLDEIEQMVREGIS
jgi:putative component of toxin-antitoxin plasmid stabilization module